MKRSQNAEFPHPTNIIVSGGPGREDHGKKMPIRSVPRRGLQNSYAGPGAVIGECAMVALP